MVAVLPIMALFLQHQLGRGGAVCRHVLSAQLATRMYLFIFTFPRAPCQEDSKHPLGQLRMAVCRLHS